MAGVPYNGTADVAPAATPPSDYQTQQASPNAFGAAIGAGEEKLGAGLTGVGKFWGQVSTDDALNNAMGAANKTLESFKGMRGGDALRAQTQTTADIDSAFKNARDGLTTEEQRYQFDQTARFFRERYIAGQISTHANQQAEFYATQTNNASYESGKGLIAANPEDPNAFNAGLAMMHGGKLKNLQLAGLSGNDDVLTRENLNTTADAVEAQVRALAPTNPTKALEIINRNRPTLAKSGHYDALSREVQAQADKQTGLTVATQAIHDAGQDLIKPPPGGFMPVNDAIIQQESRNNPTAPTSSSGAVGLGQLMPSTFKQYALPNERIDNPTDNLAVTNRIIDDYKSRWPNDPARVATAYFSGPGNVALPDAPTPYLADLKDPNGKSVSSYVQDVTARTGSAHAVKANAYDRVLAATEGNPEARRVALNEVNQRFTAAQIASLEDAKAQKEASDKAAGGYVTNILNGNSRGLDQQIANDPSLSWETKDRLTGILTSHLNNDVDRAVQTYGPGFWDTYKRVTAAPGDPARLADPGAVLRMAGPQADGGQGPLTLSGVQAINKIIEDKKTPQGEADAAITKQFFAAAKQQISGQDEILHTKDPKGELLFLKFMQSALPAIEAGKAAGKSVAELTGENGPIYKAISNFKRPMSEYIKDTMVDLGPTVPDRTLGAIISDVQSGKLSSEQGKAEAMKLNLIHPDEATPPPAAPLAKGTQPGEDEGASGSSEFPLEAVSDEDVAAGQKAGVMYGSGSEGFGETKPGKNFAGENYTAAYMIANKSPLLSLGFDPRIHQIDENQLDEDQSKGEYLQGDYHRDMQQVFTRGSQKMEDFNPTVLAHEFGHRGFDILRRAYPDNDDLKFIDEDPSGEREEALVRYLHHEATDTPVTEWEKTQWPSLANKHWPEIVGDVEKLAAKLIAERKPGGPR